MNQSFATITTRMRLNFFSRDQHPNEASGPDADQAPVADQPRTGRTFPADEVAWGITIRNGFDEMDDPWYHRGVTQHAYLESNDNVSICGFRPPQSGPRSRRRARLGMPTTGVHPMCGTCARMVVAPRPRVPVSVNPSRPPVAIPVSPGPAAPAPAPVAVPPSAARPAAVLAAPTNGTTPATVNAAAPVAGTQVVAAPPRPAAAGPAPNAPAATQAPPPATPAPPAPPAAPTPPAPTPPAPASSDPAPTPATPDPETPTSAWAQRVETDGLDPEQAAGSGLMDRGVHAEFDDE